MQGQQPLNPNVSNAIPVVESCRLVLRGFRPGDTDAFLEDMTRDIAASQDAERAHEIARHQAWRVLAMVVGSWFLEGHGYWAVELRETAELIGRVGSFQPRRCPRLEVGWHIFPAHRRQGFATEGVVAALTWYYEYLGINTATFCIPGSNLPSRALAAAVGGRLDAQRDLPHGEKLEVWVSDRRTFFESRAYRNHQFVNAEDAGSRD